MKNVLGKSKISLACMAGAVGALAFAASALAQGTAVSAPTLKMAGTITGMAVPTGPSAILTIHGTNGDEPCRFVVKKVSQGPRAPIAVEVGSRVKFPVTVNWGPDAASPINFQAVGEAAAGVKACQGSAFATFYAAVPPPPEVNP
jgi:hypothetical protein